MTTYVSAQSQTPARSMARRVAKPYANPYLAGILLGLVLFLSFFLTGNGLGASGGAGVITLSNNNTYTGNTRFVNALSGVVKVGVNNALPTTTGLSFGSGATNSGALDLNGFNQTVASLASSAGSTQNGIVNTQGATTTSILTIKGSATTTYTSSIGVANDNTTNLPNAADHHKIRLSLDAANTGKLTLSRATGQAYSGGTDINGGTLLVTNTSGSGTGTGLVTVNSGGTLGGTGTVSGPVTVTGGAIAPGASAGTLTISNTVVLNAASQLAYELLGTNTQVGGGVNDLIAGVTDLTLDGTLNVTETVANSFLSAVDGNKWRLITYSGTLTDGGLTLGSMPALSSGLAYYIDLAVAGQVNLQVVVPEAGSFAAVGLVGLMSVGAVWLRKRTGRAAVNV